MATLATVVGVLPENFVFAPTGPAELWMSPRIAGFLLRRNLYWLHPVARLKPGVSLEQAQAEIRTISRRLAMQYPDSNAGLSTDWWTCDSRLSARYSPVTGGVDGVRSASCCLSPARMSRDYSWHDRCLGGRKFLFVRAGRATNRIARQLLTESILLALIGGGAGVLAAYWAVPAIISLLPQGNSAEHAPSSGIDGECRGTLVRAWNFVADGNSVWIGPADSDLQSQPATGPSGGRPRFRRLRPPFAQRPGHFGNGSGGSSACGRGTDAQEFAPCARADPGFDPRNLLTGVVGLPADKYSDGPKQLAFQQQLLSRIRSLPGIEEVAAVTTVPCLERQYLPLRPGRTPQESGGREYEADSPTVSQNYFTVMGIPLARRDGSSIRRTTTNPLTW